MAGKMNSHDWVQMAEAAAENEYWSSLDEFSMFHCMTLKSPELWAISMSIHYRENDAN
jgi:hypothetical protein